MIDVEVLGDRRIEGPEAFSVNLSRPTNAGLFQAVGTATVVDSVLADVASVKALRRSRDFLSADLVDRVFDRAN